MDDEIRALFEGINKRIDDLLSRNDLLRDVGHKRMDDLREADKEAVRLAHQDLSHRLEGFPQQFATKEEMKAAAEGVAKLEKDAVTREIYEAQSRALSELVQKLDKEKLPESVFQTFVDNYRIDAESAAVERRAVAGALATSTSERSGRESGVAATRGQLAALILGAVAVLSVVVAIANYIFH
jgi:polyhydroxyalkanoate synthesis regulator phasin